MTVILLRHGRSTANTGGVLAGWTPGVQLDETGRQQARTVAERHVHEHDQAQPARDRGQHRGGGGGDESVDQHDRFVRHSLKDPGEGGERGGVRLRPVAGYRVLVHDPADRDEAAGDLAVVDVSSAGPGRVVDAVGNDDVDRRHRVRS